MAARRMAASVSLRIREAQQHGPYTLHIEGHVPSKKNKWKPGRGRVFLPREAQREIDSLILQVRMQWQREALEQAEIRMHFRVRDGRGDLDNKQTTILDVLVKAGVVKNDSIAHLRRLTATAEIYPAVQETVLITVCQY
jgi:Holliday junction resolvase RusA-like endonuclease